MGCFNSCHDIHRLCDECRAEFESLLDQLHQDDDADRGVCGECGAEVDFTTHDRDACRLEGTACTCALPWARNPCPNTANPADPDGYCAECRAAVDECDRTGPEWDR